MKLYLRLFWLNNATRYSFLFLILGIIVNSYSMIFFSSIILMYTDFGNSSLKAYKHLKEKYGTNEIHKHRIKSRWPCYKAAIKAFLADH
jgi:hypothetical protein